MSQTEHIHRLLVLVPAARVPALQTWIDTNIDPGQGSNWFTTGLSAYGTEPATHYVACFDATDADALKWVSRMTAQVGASVPAAWNDWSRTEKQAWVASVRASIEGAIGVTVVASDNDGNWADHMAVIESRGLQFVRVVS